eukprot:gene7061-158_t
MYTLIGALAGFIDKAAGDEAHHSPKSRKHRATKASFPSTPAVSWQ